MDTQARLDVTVPAHSSQGTEMPDFWWGMIYARTGCTGLEWTGKAARTLLLLVLLGLAVHLLLPQIAKLEHSLQVLKGMAWWALGLVTGAQVLSYLGNGISAGARFQLKLGEKYSWTVTADRQTILSRVKNVLVMRGAQGLYEAHNTGESMLRIQVHNGRL